MRIIEITGKFTIPITNEEAELLEKFSTEKKILKKDLGEREQLLANNLVIKEILTRKEIDGKLTFIKNDRNNIV